MTFHEETLDNYPFTLHSQKSEQKSQKLNLFYHFDGMVSCRFENVRNENKTKFRDVRT